MRSDFFVICWISMAVLAAGMLIAQEVHKLDSKPKYELTEVQRLKLDNLRLQAQIARGQWDSACWQLPQYITTTATFQAYQQACSVAQTENKWPSVVTLKCVLNEPVSVVDSTPVEEKKK